MDEQRQASIKKIMVEFFQVLFEFVIDFIKFVIQYNLKSIDYNIVQTLNRYIHFIDVLLEENDRKRK